MKLIICSSSESTVSELLSRVDKIQEMTGCSEVIIVLSDAQDITEDFYALTVDYEELNLQERLSTCFEDYIPGRELFRYMESLDDLEDDTLYEDNSLEVFLMLVFEFSVNRLHMLKGGRSPPLYCMQKHI